MYSKFSIPHSAEYTFPDTTASRTDRDRNTTVPSTYVPSHCSIHWWIFLCIWHFKMPKSQILEL